MKICRERPNLVNIGQNIEHFTRRLRYVLWLPATLYRQTALLFDSNGTRLFVRPSVPVAISLFISANHTGRICVKFYIGDVYKNL